MIKNKKGMTLVEVLAAIIILAIIFISFFGLLVQSKKTNKSSESISDATYLAQQEMENYYSIVKGKTVNLTGLVTQIESKGYTKNELPGTQPPNCTPTQPASYNNYGKVIVLDEINPIHPQYKIRIIIKELCDFENSISFIIEVLDKNIDTTINPDDPNTILIPKAKAIIENVFILKGAGS